MSSINPISNRVYSTPAQSSPIAATNTADVDPLNLQKDIFDAASVAGGVGSTAAPAAATTDATRALETLVKDFVAMLMQILRPSSANAAPSAGVPAGASVSPGVAQVPVSSVTGSPATARTPGVPQPNDPSTWNDNNAPYGVTLAGFSPQNHTDIPASALWSKDPANVAKNAKYLVYNYFLENKTQPTKDWAPAAAQALNQRYGTKIFHAIDGETLGYGDEYVHSAPNGYGMQRGTFNPSATGELFWGARGKQ